MFRLFLLLIAYAAFCAARHHDDGSTSCSRAEFEKCNDHCEQKFGAALLSAKCTKDEENDRHECLCKAEKTERIISEDEDEGDFSDESDRRRNNRHGRRKDRHRPQSSGSTEQRVQQQTSCIKPALVPLARFYSPPVNIHGHSTDLKHTADIIKGGWVFDGFVGYVAVNDRGCDGNKLVPIYATHKPGAKPDLLFTNSAAEVENLKNAGYTVNHGVVYYCSSRPDPKCGATLPMHRYLRLGYVHYYGTEEQGKAYVLDTKTGVHEGVMCYVWPTADSAQVSN